MPRFLSMLLFVLCVVCISLSAQTALVRGNVFDKDTGEPILYGNVFIEGTTKGTTTDLDGFYTLSGLEPGSYRLMSTYLGYDTVTVDISVKAGQKLLQNLYMTQSGINLGTVNISASREEAKTEVKISTIKVTPKQIKALPSVGGEPDIAQYLQVIPGVISTGDQGGQLYIRGGSPVQNKILLDGFSIYNPFHSIGFFSVFETDLIKNVDVLTGGFNAEHGGRISAIVDIKTREGNKVRPAGSLSVSPFVAKAMFETPIVKFQEGKGSTSVVLSAKKSLIAETSKNLYAYAADVDSIGLPFDFQDIYGKVSMRSTNGSYLDLFGFNFSDTYNNPLLAKIGWDNVGAGANFNLIPNGSDIIVSGSAGFTNYESEIDSENDAPRSSSIRELGARLDFTFFQEYGEIKYGLDLRSIRTDFKFTNTFKQDFSQAQNTTEISGYLKYKAIIGRLVLEPSMRLMYYASQSQFSPEPRLGIKYNASDKFRIKLAGGLYSQNLLSAQNERDVVNLFSGFLSGPEEQVLGLDGEFLDNKLQKSRHAVAGIEYDLTDDLEINVEGYLKDYPQLITINRNKLQATDPDYIQEEGQAYGVDVSLRYELPRLYLWATYSHGYVNRYDGMQRYPTVFDRRHNVNTMVTFSLDKDQTWEVSARWNLGSGFPFTKTQGFYNGQTFIDGPNSPYETDNPDQVTILYSNERNGGRLPYYHRLDVSMTKRIKFSNYMGMEANVGVTNAYNRENIFYFDRVEYDRVNQLPIIPSAALKFTF